MRQVLEEHNKYQPMISDYQTRLSTIKIQVCFRILRRKKYTRLHSIWEVHQHQETEVSQMLSDFENKGVQLQLEAPYTNRLLLLLRDFAPWVNLYHQIEERHDIFLPTDEVHPKTFGETSCCRGGQIYLSRCSNKR